MKFSRLGQQLAGETGTLQLMRDLGAALAAEQPPLMLGGGNPARIEEVESIFRARLQTLAQSEQGMHRILGSYDGARGDQEFLDDLAELLREQCGWPVTRDNIAITNGSQTAFFYLFNLFAGVHEDGRMRRIFLPLAPEYMGYADQGLVPGSFVSHRPRIELLDDGLFKYRLDLAPADVPDDIAAICVSRPTNPTGNVLTADELNALAEIARERDIPLLIDNAYGSPFPNILFVEAQLPYASHCVYCLSLSKLGLPGVRTGIVVGPPQVIAALEAINAVVSLASNSMGPALVHDMVRSREIVRLGAEVVQPFYAGRRDQALAWLQEALAGLPCRVHKPEGAFFFWVWCEGLPISSQALYERLKQEGVIIVPGHYFFPGLDDDWAHRNECLRINYGADENTVREGLHRIGAVLRSVYGNA